MPNSATATIVSGMTTTSSVAIDTRERRLTS
jgi:hypothetical protein